MNEEDLVEKKGPISPEKITAGMSADEPFDQGATPIPKLPPIPAPVGIQPATQEQVVNLAEDQARQAQADAERQAREAEAAAAKEARTRQAVETKRLQEQGVKMTVNDVNEPVPQKRPDGSTVYEPGWTGAPRFDGEKKTWVRDRRDETGNVSPVDLWDNGDISRDADTGELYFSTGGVRTVVGKDESYLRRRSIGQEIDTLTRQQEEKDLSLDREEQAWKPLEEDFKAKDKIFQDKASRLKNMQALAAKNPAWAERNAAQIDAAAKDYEATRQEIEPLQKQAEALASRKREVEAERIRTRERKLALYTERDTIEAARTRPTFAAPASPPAGESPDVTADREKRGIAGEAYSLPDMAREDTDFQNAMRKLDVEAERLAPPGMSLGPDPTREAKLAEVNAKRRDLIAGYSARKAAVQKFQDTDTALNLERAKSEGRANGLQFLFQKQTAALDQALRSGKMTSEAYDAARQEQERQLLTEADLQEKIRTRRADLKRETSKALAGQDEFPPTLITKTPNGTDLDPRAVLVRAAGQAAAFGTDETSELYDTLLALQGKVQSVGGRPLKDLIRDVGAAKGMKVADLLTSDEQQALREGLRGGLITEQRALLGNVYWERDTLKDTPDGVRFGKKLEAAPQAREVAAPALDGTQTLSRPVGEGEQAVKFWAERFAQSLATANGTVSRGTSATPNVPQYQADILRDRNAILSRQPALPDGMPAGEKRKALEAFQAAKLKDLAAYDEKNLAMGGDRADFIKSLQGEKQQSFASALLDELAGRIRAAIFSPTAGVWQIGAQLLDTMALVESKSLGIPPEESSLRQLAQAARQGTQDLMGEKSDTLLAQLGQGAGTSLAFAPVAMLGGGLAVAGLGFASGFGSGYYDAKEKADAAGKKLSETQLYLNALLSAGLNSTEGLPMAHALNRLDKFTGGSLKRLLDIGKETLEEGAQEFLQNAYQDYAYKLQGLDDRTWEEIRGDALEAGGVAALSGLLLGVGMNFADEHFHARHTRKLEGAFGVLDKTYTDLKEAVRSPEALTKYNLTLEGQGKAPLTETKAADLLRQVSGARAKAAVQVLANDPQLIDSTVKALAPGEDAAKISSQILTRTGVLAEAMALGREYGSLLGDTPASPLKHAAAGFIILNRMETLLRGGKIDTALGQALEKEGLLVQKATPNGGTRWMLTGPALSLLDGDTRRAVAKTPNQFAYAPEADTAAPGSLTTELRNEGDRQISQAVTPVSQPVSPTAGAGTYEITFTSEADKQGFTTRRTAQVTASSPEEARTLAETQTSKWGGKWTPAEIRQTKSPDSASPPAYSPGDATAAPQSGPAQPANVGGETSPVPAVEAISGGPAPAGPDPGPATEGNPPPRPDYGEVTPVGESAPGSAAETPAPLPSGARVPRGTWADQGHDRGLLRAVFTLPGFRWKQQSGAGTRLVPEADGTIQFVYDPKSARINGETDTDVESAQLDEEVRHAAAMLAKRKEWQASGSPQTFPEWLAEDGKAMFQDLIARIGELESQERATVEKALLGSINLYFGQLSGENLKVKTLADIEPWMRRDKTDHFLVVQEFARQLSQLRDIGSITESTHLSVLETILAWVNEAFAALKSLALQIDAEGNVLDGTAIQRLVLDMDAELKWLNGQIHGAGLAQMREEIARDQMTPVINWLDEQGGVIGKGKATNPGGEYDDAVPVTRLGGHARRVYGNALTPDEAAQALFDAGLISDPYPATMWRAIESEIKTLRGMKNGPRGLRARLFDGIENDPSMPEANRAAATDDFLKDASGNILTLWHGGEKSDSLRKGKPYYLIDDLDAAASYADRYKNSEIRPYHVRMSNPLDLTDISTAKTWLGKDIVEGEFSDPLRNVTNNLPRETGILPVIARAKSAGFDGLIVPDTDQMNRGSHKAYVVFEPSQAVHAVVSEKESWGIPIRSAKTSGQPSPGGRVAKVTDFSTDPAWADIAYNEPTPESIKRLKEWLKSNPEAIVRMYHGTAAKFPVKEQGLLRTTAHRRNSLQSRSGFVSLSIYPDMAKWFAKMAYPQQELAVYPVEVPVRMLVADADQLKNKRMWADYKGGSSLAESIAVGHGAQIKGDVPVWAIKSPVSPKSPAPALGAKKMTSLAEIEAEIDQIDEQLVNFDEADPSTWMLPKTESFEWDGKSYPINEAEALEMDFDALEIEGDAAKLRKTRARYAELLARAKRLAATKEARLETLREAARSLEEQAAGSETPFSQVVTKANDVSIQEFAELARAGQLRQATGAPSVNNEGTGRTPLSLGHRSGYSLEDIARFYVERRSRNAANDLAAPGDPAQNPSIVAAFDDFMADATAEAQNLPDFTQGPEYDPKSDAISTTDTLGSEFAFERAQDSEFGRSERDAIEAARDYVARVYNGRAGEVAGYRGGLLRERGAGEAGAVYEALRAALHAAFGRRVVFISGIPPEGFQAAVFPKDAPDVILVSKDATYPLLHLLGHELGHSIKAGNPELYREFQEFILGLAGDRTAHNAHMEERKYPPEKWDDEFVNDFMGSEFSQKGFWQALADKDANLFRRVAMAALALIDRIKKRILPLARDVRPMITDLDAARAGLVEMLNRFSREGDVGANGVWTPLNDADLMAGSSVPQPGNYERSLYQSFKDIQVTGTPPEKANATKMLARLERLYPSLRRTIQTTGEGNLFAESELPFNLQGEIDTSSIRRAILEDEQAAQEAQRQTDQSQGTLLAKTFENATVTGPGLIPIRGLAAKAFHGTPHEIDPAEGFRTDRIGTGEGAQAYGWGLYFAENESVAEEYKRQLARDGKWFVDSKEIKPSPAAAMVLTSANSWMTGGKTKEQWIKWVREDQQEAWKTGDHQWDADIDATIASIEAANEIRHEPGNVYTVDLAVEPDELLDWDKPLSEQSEKVKTTLSQLLAGRNLPETTTGEMAYAWIATGFVAQAAKGGWTEVSNDTDVRSWSGEKGSSQALSKAGILGIRYLDQGSRGSNSSVWKDGEKWAVTFADPTRGQSQTKRFDTEAEARAFDKSLERTYNYVIFDESRIRILEKNGEPVSEETRRGLMAKPVNDPNQVSFDFGVSGTLNTAGQPALALSTEKPVQTDVETPAPAPITTIESVLKLYSALREGNVTAAQMKAAWEEFKAAEPALEAEAAGMTMKQLARFQGMRGASNKKEAVRGAMDFFTSIFNPLGSLSFAVGTGDYRAAQRAAMDSAVAQWTDEGIQKDAAAVRENRAAREKALTNPETLDEFEAFIYKAGTTGMTPEQVARAKGMSDTALRAYIGLLGRAKLTDDQLERYDALNAERSMARAASQEAAAKPTTVAQVANLGGTEMEMVETEHTRDKYPLWVVRLSDRVGRDVYTELNSKAKALGGYYSSFRGNGAIPGFQFKSREAAEKFMALKEGDVDRTDLIEAARAEREAETTGNAVERLRTMADRMEAAAEEALNADRRQNTARQADMAATAEARAHADIQMARTMRNLATAIEDGTIRFLKELRTRTQIETLQSLLREARNNLARSLDRASQDRYSNFGREVWNRAPERTDIRHAIYPQPTIPASRLSKLVNLGENTSGLKRASARLSKLIPSDLEAMVKIPDSFIDDLKLVARGLFATDRWEAESALSRVVDYDRLQNMGIRTSAHLRAALREYFDHKGAKVVADPMKALERELIGKNLPGFFPTPPGLVQRVIETAQIEPGMAVLEPSAGKGDMAVAARAAGGEVEVAEMQSILIDLLKAQGFEPIGRDFLTMPIDPRYDRVVMNPPFEDRADAAHVRHAFEMLKPGGRLVAVMSAGTLQASTGEEKAFQDWVDAQGGVVDDVESGTFAAADSFRKTGVNVKLVTIDKAGALRAKPLDDTRYLELAKNPETNREELQRMVATAARAAGYDSPLLYHGTPDSRKLKAVPVFDRTHHVTLVKDPDRAADIQRRLDEEASLPEHPTDRYFEILREVSDNQYTERQPVPVFLTENRSIAKTYADARRAFDYQGAEPSVFQFYARFTNPMEIDARGVAWGKRGGPSTQEAQIQEARAKGHDGMIIRRTKDSYQATDRGPVHDVYVAFSPSQIKSADPVTYDEQGNVIPLSRRFNPGSNSILFSKPLPSPQRWFNFGPDGSQRAKYQLPLTLADGMRGATPAEDGLFFKNIGLAYKIAGDYRNVGELDDVRQESLIALSRAVKTYQRERGKFSTWAGAVIRNHLNSLYRSRDRIHAASLDAELGDSGRSLEDIIPSHTETPAMSAQRAEALSILRETIATLPGDLRDVMTARLAGRTQEQIGTERGVTKQTVSGMEKVALGLLKSRMKARGVDKIALMAKSLQQPGQEVFSSIEKDLFPSMMEIDRSVPPSRTVTPEEALAMMNEVLRDVQNVADEIEKEPENVKPATKSTLRDHYNRHFRGRFDKLDYFAPGAGGTLLDTIRDNAMFAAAMRRFTTALDDKVKAAFGHPSYWRNRSQAQRLKRFKAEILPFAAALNPVARDAAGDLVFDDFWQRAGELSGKQVESMGRAPGDEWQDSAGRWRITGYVVPNPAKPQEGFYQLERFIPAPVQNELHAEFHDRFPEAAYLLDDFIEPGQEQARVVSPQGVELPAFNRHSLYGFYGDTPAGLVEKLPGYTPDVARTKSLAGAAAKVLKLNWNSPGRDYKSGQARVTGQVRDLFEGFNIRAAQAHMEKARREGAEKLLLATLRPVPETGLPPEYSRLDRDTLNPLIRAMREASRLGQGDMPEIMASATDQLTQRDLKTLSFLFGDPALFDPNQMIHREVLAELERGFVRLKLDNEFLDGVMSWLRGSVAGVLADFQTISINKLSNYIFHAMRIAQVTAYAGLSATTGDKPEATRAFREAAYLVRGFFTNFFHDGIRDRMNRMVPPETFEDQNVLRQLMAENADLSVTDLLKQANVGGAFLKAVGYGEMDVRAKQKLALASLLARASIEADAAGITGPDRKAWMQRWVENAPLDARRESELGAKLYLMDYANVPWWLDQGRKVEIAGNDVTPWVNFIRAMAIPFWKFPYNYLKQMKRLGPDSVRTLLSKEAESQEKRQAGANLISLAMLMTAYWLLSHPWDDEDKTGILGREVDDAGEELDPKLRTGSRVRLADSSLIGMAMNTAARLFGAETTSDDLWVRVRTFPYATQAIALGAALKFLSAPQSGNAKESVTAAWDMIEDFLSVGSGARMGAMLFGYRDDYTRDQETPFLLTQGAFDMVTGRIFPPRLLKDISTWIDPVNRRYSPAASLDYNPGAFEAILSRVPGASKNLPPSGTVVSNADPNSEKTQAARMELEAMGLADRGYREYLSDDGKLRAAYVRPDFIFQIPGWKAWVRQLGFNVKPVPAGQYEDALAGIEQP